MLLMVHLHINDQTSKRISVVSSGSSQKMITQNQDGRQSHSWHTMECCLFLLDIHLDLECSRWNPLEGVRLMVPECMPVMAQGSQVKQSSHLQSIRASIWLLWSSGSTDDGGVLSFDCLPPPFYSILVGHEYYF
ncbi:hypothetical protein S245_015598 [Arachis hypogaea]